jgi:glycosyltransferase involved in cell wall biosynthesis
MQAAGDPAPGSKRRILFVNVGESRHGSTYRARKLCQLLRAGGRDVFYVESNYEDTETSCSIPQPDTTIGLIAAAARRVRLCWQRDYDVLFLQKPLPPTAPCVLVAKLRGKKVALDFDDLDSRWQSTAVRRGLTALCERWIPRCADLVTTHNRYLREHVERTTGVAAALVSQGVDARLFDATRYDRRAEKERAGVAGRAVCCFLGSFTLGSARDLDVILRAVHLVSRRRRDIKLLIIGGGGPLEDRYRRLISELGIDVRITGRLAQSEVPRFLAAADLGLIYMADDRANEMRMSLKVLEYLAMELTVVGRLVGATKDAFEPYCFSCGPSEGSLASRIEEVLGEGARKPSARGLISRDYDWAVIGASLEEAVGRIEQ